MATAGLSAVGWRARYEIVRASAVLTAGIGDGVGAGQRAGVHTWGPVPLGRRVELTASWGGDRAVGGRGRGRAHRRLTRRARGRGIGRGISRVAAGRASSETARSWTGRAATVVLLTAAVARRHGEAVAPPTTAADSLAGNQEGAD